MFSKINKFIKIYIDFSDKLIFNLYYNINQ